MHPRPGHIDLSPLVWILAAACASWALVLLFGSAVSAVALSILGGAI